MRLLELLSPAKNLQCGIAAIDHGADAVYIGAKRFGARASAGNSLEDIEQLCQYAHRYGAKVYVTVNTIIYDQELNDTRQLLSRLKDIQVDAVLVQDMALLDLNTEHLELHASTQTDNRTIEKVQWLKSLGFKRVVLARELSVKEISAIHQAVPDVELEAFVHGALCVSYSGLCYASQHCFGRSANRGECAQFCRMKFDLIDASGRLVESQRYLLSLKDMCQYDNLERLAEAGVTSFKIEGRLKDEVYVKNVTAAYSERLNQLVAQHPDVYRRASQGRVTYRFTPNLKKTFNRGYTTYFANGRQPSIASFDTPKAMGEYVGDVKELRGRQSFNVAGTSRFANGDGLCFVNDQRELEGFRVNRVEGNRIFPLKMPASLRPGMRLYRNNDQEFERLLSRPSAERKIPVTMRLAAVKQGYALSMNAITVVYPFEHQKAQTSQRENIVRQLTKLGGTPYECIQFELADDFNFFIPGSVLSDMRRMVVAQYEADSMKSDTSALQQRISEPSADRTPQAKVPLPDYVHSYCYNIANAKAASFYQQQGLRHASKAFELQEPENVPLMQCRHCIRYSLGGCVKNGGKRKDWQEPLYLRLNDGQRFRLAFDCQHCQMNVYAESH